MGATTGDNQFGVCGASLVLRVPVLFRPPSQLCGASRKKLEWSGIGWMFSKRFGPEPSAEPQTNCGALLYCLIFSLFAFSRFPIWFPLFVYICIYTHIYSSAFPFCFRNHRSPHGLLLNCFSVSVSTYGRRATACDLNAFKLFQPD